MMVANVYSFFKQEQLCFETQLEVVVVAKGLLKILCLLTLSALWVPIATSNINDFFKMRALTNVAGSLCK